MSRDPFNEKRIPSLGNLIDTLRFSSSLEFVFIVLYRISSIEQLNQMKEQKSP